MNLKMLAMWLLVIGGLVWGIVGVTGNNPLDSLGTIARIIYLLVGASAVYGLIDMLGGKK